MEASSRVRPANGLAEPRAGALTAAAGVRTAGAWADHPAPPRRAAVGVILGTGLGGLADRVESAVALPSVETGWLRRSTATGHAGRIVCGTWCGTPVAMLQGRVHGYEGFPPEALGRGVELLAALGVSTLLLTNASGGLRPDMRPGELVIVTDHLDLVRRRWDTALCGRPPALPRPLAAAPPCYDPALAAAALAATRRAGSVSRPGVYALLSGPTYETRAEYRMLRRLGADVVGMSTVPEVIVARALGLRVVVCSVVTNVARPDAPARTDAEDVCQMAASAETGVAAIIDAVCAAHAAGR